MTQTYKVQVSMNQAHIVESGFVWKQGDFGFNIEIEVLDFDTTGATPQIIFRKSTGAVEATQISVAGNKFTYAIRGTELDTPGPCVCDLKLKDSTTKRVSTASFKYFVIPDTMDGLEQEASSYSDTIAQIVGGFDDEIEGINNNLNVLNNDVALIGDAIKNDSAQEITYDHNQKYIKLNGETADVTEFLDLAGYQCVVVACTEGTSFYVTAKGQNATRAWGFVAANGTVLSVEEANREIRNKHVIAPQNTAYFVSNNYAAVYDGKITEGDMAYISSEELKNKTIDLDKQIYSTTGNNEIYYENDEAYIKLNGSTADITQVIPLTDYECVATPCIPGDVFIVTASGQNATRAWGFVAANGTVLSVEDANQTIDYKAVTAPSNAAYFVSNNRKSVRNGKITKGYGRLSAVDNVSISIPSGGTLKTGRAVLNGIHFVYGLGNIAASENFPNDIKTAGSCFLITWRLSENIEQIIFSNAVPTFYVRVISFSGTVIRDWTNISDPTEVYADKILQFNRVADPEDCHSGKFSESGIIFTNKTNAIASEIPSVFSSAMTLFFLNIRYNKGIDTNVEQFIFSNQINEIYFRVVDYTTGTNVRGWTKLLECNSGSPKNKWYVLGDSISAGYYSITEEEAAEKGVTISYRPSDYGYPVYGVGSVWDASLKHNYWGYANEYFLKRTLSGKAYPGQGYFKKASNNQNGIYVVKNTSFADAGLITVAWGFNDWHYDQPRGDHNLLDASVPYPTENYDTTQLTTVNHAIWYCLGELIRKAPQAKIVVQTPMNGWLYGGDFSTNWGIGYAMEHSGTLKDIHDDIKYWADYYGLQVLDMTFNNSMVNRLNIKDSLIDGSHPTDPTHQQLGRHVATMLGYC